MYEYDSRYLEYFELFKREKFFEAHEVLEALWRETRGEEREFYHGLIQLAAALVHFQKGNLHGAKELFKKAAAYLQPYPATYRRVRISQVLEAFRRFLEGWSRDPDKPSLAKEHLPRVILEKE